MNARKFTLVLLLLFGATVVSASPQPGPEDFPVAPPDPLLSGNFVCRIIHISYSCDTCGDLELKPTLMDELPAKLQDYFPSMFHNSTYDVDVIRYYYNGAPTDSAWVPAHSASHYRDNVGYAEANKEVMHAIIAQYDAEQLPPPFANCDYIFFLHGCKIWEDYEGMAGTGLGSLEDWQQYNVKSVGGFHGHRNWHDGDSGGDPVTGNVRQLERTLYLSAHEHGHNRGCGHPNYNQETDGLYYGVYDLMRPTLIGAPNNVNDFGIPPISPVTLLGAGFLASEDVVEVAEETLSIPLYDFGTEARNVIVIPIEPLGGLHQNERFVLSYHNQSGYDARLPSHGMQIWHSFPRNFNDIETASGRWDVQVNPIIEDPIDGLDKMDWDYWASPNTPYYNDHNFKFRFPGNVDDLFDVNAYPEGIEVSYRTNPSTWGATGTQRLDSNAIPTTLFIHARPGLDDSHILVDVYPMPREDILSPANGHITTVGGRTLVAWDDQFYDDALDGINVLDEVEVWFSPHNGIPHSYLRVATLDYDAFSFDWTPTGYHVTDGSSGKMKLVFTNNLENSSMTTETVMDGTITVLGDAIPWETLVAPNGAEVIYLEDSFDIQWTGFSAATVLQVDISGSTDGGMSWQPIAIDAVYTTYDGMNTYQWTPTIDYVGDDNRIKVTIHFENGPTPSYVSEGSFTVYPLGAEFTDVSAVAGLDYQGIPYSAVTLDYNTDGQLDMLVTIQVSDNPQGMKSHLYQNWYDQQYPIRFDDRTDQDFAQGSVPEYQSHGAAVGDYDRDGYPDIFVTHRDLPQLFNYDSAIGKFVNVIADTTLFKPADAELLKNSYCAAWVDYNHDGFLDLYVGRARLPFSSEAGLRNDVSKLTPLTNSLFENRGSGPFLEVAAAVGFRNISATMAVAWADMNGDGFWEVAVGGLGSSPGESTVLYKQDNQYPHHFGLVASGFPAGVKLDNVNSLQWVDIDRDNDLDLLIVRSDQESYVAINNQGSLTDSIEFPGTGYWASSCGMSFDFDLDGFPEVLLGNVSEDRSPQLLMNLMGAASFSDLFLDAAERAGLSEIQASVQGVLAADFSGNGSRDLFLGRQTSGGRIFHNQQVDSVIQPANEWLGFRLNAIESGSAIGTQIRIASQAATLGVQQIDGGSGRGTQEPDLSIFGLGKLSTPVDVEVIWPNRVVGFTVNPNDFGQIITVDEPESFSIDSATLDFRIEIEPYTGIIDWIFTWETSHWTNPGNDIVSIQYVDGTDCGFSTVSLQADVTSDVKASISRKVDPNTAEISYLHELRWENQPCYVGCRYRFGVESTRGQTTHSVAPAAGHVFRFKICPQSL